MVEWEQWRSLISFPPCPESVGLLPLKSLEFFCVTFYKRTPRISRQRSQSFVNLLPNFGVSAESCFDGADCWPTMDGGGGGGGGGRCGGGPGRWPSCWTSWQLSGATRSGTTAEVFFKAWPLSFVSLYGLITLGSNLAFKQQKYRLYKCL